MVGCLVRSAEAFPVIFLPHGQRTQSRLDRQLIWGIADDVLRDVYVRGKYRNLILPMTVLRRLDPTLEPTRQDVLNTKAFLDKTASAARTPHSDKRRNRASTTPPGLPSTACGPQNQPPATQG